MEREREREEEKKVLYLCDGKACEKFGPACNGECKHTADIDHAINFKPGEHNTFWEQEKSPECPYFIGVDLGNMTDKFSRENLISPNDLRSVITSNEPATREDTCFTCAYLGGTTSDDFPTRVRWYCQRKETYLTNEELVQKNRDQDPCYVAVPYPVVELPD